MTQKPLTMQPFDKYRPGFFGPVLTSTRELSEAQRKALLRAQWRGRQKHRAHVMPDGCGSTNALSHLADTLATLRDAIGLGLFLGSIAFVFYVLHDIARYGL